MCLAAAWAPIPDLLRHIDHSDAIHHAGAAEGVIDLAILGDRRLHHRGDALGIADVDLHGDRIALVVANLRCDFFRRFLRVVGDNDVQAIRGQPPADVRTNAACSSGYDDRFAPGRYSLWFLATLSLRN